MNAPRLDIFAGSMIFLLVGASGMAGLLPLAYMGVDTITVSGLSVDATPGGTVSYDLTLTSNWDTSIDVEIWSQVKTSSGTVVLGPKQNIETVAGGETKSVSHTLGQVSPASSSYTLELFFWENAEALAPPASKSFNVPLPITVEIWKGPASAHGSVTPTYGIYDLNAGDSFTVSASPDSGYEWAGWVIDPDPDIGLGTVRYENPFTFNPTKDTLLIPQFTGEPTVSLTIEKKGSGSGSTRPFPGSYTYSPGESVTVTALPRSDSELSFWLVVTADGDNYESEDNPITVYMDWDTTLTVYFTEKEISEYTLTMSVTPANGGDTSPAIGRYEYQEGWSVTINAFPFEGFEFSHWLVNAERETERPLTITMDRDTTVQAVFTDIPVFDVTVSTFPAGAGTVEPKSGTYQYERDEQVTFMAFKFTQDYEFTHWTIDGEENTDSTITLTITSDLDLVAHYKELGDPPCDVDCDQTQTPMGWLSPVLTGVGVLGAVGSMFVPGGRRLSSGGRK